jgi:hypothetical protein
MKPSLKERLFEDYTPFPCHGRKGVSQ